MDDTEQRRVLHTIVTNMARDVAGNFDPRVYRFARRAVPAPDWRCHGAATPHARI